jgi:predicted 3-demethylubiquinone-9 3-methyltransferase (glyoxalase superfamily)
MTQVGTKTTTVAGKLGVQSVRPCLTFEKGTEDAVNFYVSMFPNSRVVSLLRSQGGAVPEGNVLHASFVLDGQEYTAFDGGPSFKFTEGFSFVATCETQAELDAVWARLTADGGEEGPCGWLKDRFGVSWQVVPAALGRMMSDPASGNPAKMMEALLKMHKLDIATLERAYRSGS